MKVFFSNPLTHRDIPASDPHPPNTCYRVSYGHEMWDDGPQAVTKIQMLYNGKVSGRRSPSFPEGTGDFQRVADAMHELHAFLPGSDFAVLARKNMTSSIVDGIVADVRNRPK